MAVCLCCSAKNAEFMDNSVTTSKYTAWNFVPVFLFQQFSRFANAYFLLVCVLQCIPVISITNGIPTSIFPLAFVLFFDGLVTAREDYKRHRDDAKANSKQTWVLRPAGSFVKAAWKDICVGDIVKVRFIVACMLVRFSQGSKRFQVLRGEEFPADIVFLSAMHEDPEQRGMCHVQTAQLDGETNLKLRRSPDAVVSMFLSDAACAAFNGHVECEQPTEHFGKFTGKLARSDTDTVRGWSQYCFVYVCSFVRCCCPDWGSVGSKQHTAAGLRASKRGLCVWHRCVHWQPNQGMPP